MDPTRSALLLLAALWSLQVYAGWRQWRHVQSSIEQATRSHADGYLGVGQFRPRFGFRRIVMLAVDPELRVRRLQTLGGMSVFARFRDVTGHAGDSLDALRVSLQRLGTPKPLAEAMRAAMAQVEQAHCKRA